MPVLALGYIGVDARDFEPWRAFGTDVLAMQVVERGADAMGLRMDERCQRVLVQRADRDGPAFFGFETADAQALRETVKTIEAAGVKTTRATERELLLRRVEDMAWCLDPAGNRIELFHGQAAGEGPLVLPRPHGGFRTGRMGMGHLECTLCPGVNYTAGHCNPMYTTPSGSGSQGPSAQESAR